MTEKQLELSGLSFVGEDQEPAILDFSSGLNVVCGASDTGKSFVIETIDFMLGGGTPPRDLPERLGYEAVVLGVKSLGHKNCLERGVSGGGFKLFDTAMGQRHGSKPTATLSAKHKADAQDNLSGWLLSRCGLLGKRIQTNMKGGARSLSFRDLARLVVVQEQEVIKKESPFLTGQYTTKTAEKSTLKLMLSGVDDSALVSESIDDAENESRVVKVSLVDEWIYDLQNEIERSSADRDMVETQLREVEGAISGEKETLEKAQGIFDEAIATRSTISREKGSINNRIEEIGELLSRFELLGSHYEVDLSRLASIQESGILLTHQACVPCPLCGAEPAEQHLESDCDGNIEEIVAGANAEIAKINQLRKELKETVSSLETEREELVEKVAKLEKGYAEIAEQIRHVESPKLGEARELFSGLIEKRDSVRRSFALFDRLDALEKQREDLLGSRVRGKDAEEIHGDLSKSVLQEFSEKVESILRDWDFPDIGPVYFDESATDFVINGKPRGSRGKGLRAITHAAITIGLMEYCLDKKIPHPGFVAIDSPLLSYYEPEGDEDNLQGSDLKERFYNYASAAERRGQIIIIDNEHPPESTLGNVKATVFSKNPELGRYGFFPLKSG